MWLVSACVLALFVAHIRVCGTHKTEGHVVYVDCSRMLPGWANFIYMIHERRVDYRTIFTFVIHHSDPSGRFVYSVCWYSLSTRLSQDADGAPVGLDASPSHHVIAFGNTSTFSVGGGGGETDVYLDGITTKEVGTIATEVHYLVHVVQSRCEKNEQSCWAKYAICWAHLDYR